MEGKEEAGEREVECGIKFWAKYSSKNLGRGHGEILNHSGSSTENLNSLNRDNLIQGWRTQGAKWG